VSYEANGHQDALDPFRHCEHTNKYVPIDGLPSFMVVMRFECIQSKQKRSEHWKVLYGSPTIGQKDDAFYENRTHI
jgi:hypothetical protein